MRRSVGALQLGLGLVCVYFLSRAAITFFAPESIWQAPPAVGIINGQNAPAQSARLDPNFDAFHRDNIVTDEVIEIGTDAPETTLNLRLVGRRAGEDGSAILQTADKTQKVFRIGEDIMDGVTLKAVHADYIVLSQGGRIERLTFERDNTTLLTTPDEDDAAEDTRKDFATPIKSIPKNMTAERFLAGVTLAPAMKNGSLAGFSIKPKNGKIDLAALGLQSGDIVSAIGAIDLTSPTLNPASIAGQLSGLSQVRLTVTRGGQIVYVDLGQ